MKPPAGRVILIDTCQLKCLKCGRGAEKKKNKKKAHLTHLGFDINPKQKKILIFPSLSLKKQINGGRRKRERDIEHQRACVSVCVTSERRRVKKKRERRLSSSRFCFCFCPLFCVSREERERNKRKVFSLDF